MESQNCLGIYISKYNATAVCLDPQGKDGNISACFNISIEQTEKGDPDTNRETLAGLIAHACSERKLKFSKVAVAMDSTMLMQHSVHSEFSDPRQISATIRFDTEEALATDISEVALAFEITSTDQTGSNLTVFSAQRKILSDILAHLQKYNFDPVTMEPDVNCLSRFLRRKMLPDEPEQTGTLYGILSQRNGYLIIPPATDGDGTKKASVVRTFLVGPKQNRADLLAREILLTAALVENTEPISSLQIFDSTDSIDNKQLEEKLNIATDTINLHEADGFKKQTIEETSDPVDLAIAYGAALSHSDKTHIANFRDDFDPFQGKKLKLQKTLKFAVVSITALLIALGLYLQIQLINTNRNNNSLRSKFAKDYAAVSLDKLSNDESIRDAVKKLGRLYRRIEAEKKGLITDEKSISSKLALILAAFNKCAAETNLNLDTITITSRDISIIGDTSSRQNTDKFFKEVRDSGLNILQERYGLKGNRDTFSIKVEPKR